MVKDKKVVHKVQPKRKTHIETIEANEAWQNRIGAEWGEKAARHMHIQDGFTILALEDGEPIGLISVCWKKLPPPLNDTVEGYIDIIEVLAGYRRLGIARQLIELSAERSREYGAYQLRAWSSEEKTEAIPMWEKLGFGLYPATVTAKSAEIHGYFVTKVL